MGVLQAKQHLMVSIWKTRFFNGHKSFRCVINHPLSAESRSDLLQSVQDILNVSIEEEPTMPRLESMEPPTPGEATSPAGDSDPGEDEAAVFKIPGLISDFKSSLSSYFAPTSAKTRISRGDKFTVKARRLILSGDIAYLIDWESTASSTTSS